MNAIDRVGQQVGQIWLDPRLIQPASPIHILRITHCHPGGGLGLLHHLVGRDKDMEFLDLGQWVRICAVACQHLTAVAELNS